ncbi:glycosyl transferase, partial [Perkinsus olseni]
RSVMVFSKMSSTAPRRYLPGDENSRLAANRYGTQPPLKRRRTVTGGVSKNREDTVSTGGSYPGGVFGGGLPPAVGYRTEDDSDVVTPERRPETGLSSALGRPRVESYESLTDALEEFREHD